MTIKEHEKIEFIGKILNKEYCRICKGFNTEKSILQSTEFVFYYCRDCKTSFHAYELVWNERTYECIKIKL